MKYLSCILVVMVVSLSGCTTNVTVDGTVPTPLVTKMPVKIAIYYDDSFKNFIHSETLREEGKWVKGIRT